MERVIVGILILVGLINLYPIIGVLSAEMVYRLYKINAQSNDIVILLRHRATLFGLLGAFIIYSAFKPKLHLWSVAIGLISMLSFIILALLDRPFGAGIRKVIIADIIASAGLFIVLMLRLWLTKSS
ncbi:MAG: phosphopantetheine adenylyltransferase [Acidobacteriota bacterium]